MRCFVRSLVVMTLLFPMSATLGMAGGYSDPAGFSLTYPDGWVAITDANMKETFDAFPPGVQTWIRNNRFDMSAIKVILLRDGDPEGFLENVNVVVGDGEIELNEKTVDELRRIVPQKFFEAGMKADNLRIRLEQRGGRPMVVSDYRLVLPGELDVDGAVQQRQFQVPGGGKTFTITCTAQPDTFATWEPVFEEIGAAFQPPPSQPRGVSIRQVAQSSAVWGVVGALVGGLVGGAISIFRKKPKPPSPPPLPSV